MTWFRILSDMQRANPSGNQASINAGDFDTWLEKIQESFHNGRGTAVPCGDCRGCCTSSYFIHIKPTDTEVISVIPRRLLWQAPGLPIGHRLIGHKPNGDCPMLHDGNCSIYAARPSTCKDYDCRVFAAAGLLAEGATASAINKRILAWEFLYTNSASLARHQGVKEAAQFILGQRKSFPQERAPTKVADVAILAIKVHHVFLNAPRDRSVTQTALAVAQASRQFDTR